MAFISSQWLKGKPERNRSYLPIRASISMGVTGDEWSVRNTVKHAISIKRPDGDFIELLLDSDESEILLKELTGNADRASRREEALEYLIELSQPELFIFLREMFQNKI